MIIVTAKWKCCLYNNAIKLDIWWGITVWVWARSCIILLQQFKAVCYVIQYQFLRWTKLNHAPARSALFVYMRGYGCVEERWERPGCSVSTGRPLAVAQGNTGFRRQLINKLKGRRSKWSCSCMDHDRCTCATQLVPRTLTTPWSSNIHSSHTAGRHHASMQVHRTCPENPRHITDSVTCKCVICIYSCIVESDIRLSPIMFPKFYPLNKIFFIFYDTF